MKEIIIGENDAQQRVDKFLQKTFPEMTKSLMYKSIRKKKIKVNRQRCTPDQRLECGDQILLFLPPDVLIEKDRRPTQGSASLDIVYEDENLLILHKPVGLLCQSDHSSKDTLVDRMKRYLFHKEQGTDLSFSPALCQRLDRNTEGLVIGAKNAKTLRLMNEAIAARKIHKYYQAECVGILQESQFLSLYLKKEGTKALVSNHPLPGYRLAEMDIRPIQVKQGSTLIEIELHTGRFHQIRALCGYLDHPLVGDRKYGYKGNQKRYRLVAYRLDLRDVDIPLKQKIFEIPGL